MNPKFSVDEVVILQSVECPEFNGDHSVTEIRVGTFKEQSSELSVEGIGYRLGGTGDEWWCESALRKKHQPGEQSFTDLMASLKNPVSV